jgi:hypothetical protein
MKISVECCEGKGESCLEDRCPIYRKAKEEIDRNWPYIGTGFGNLYGNPDKKRYLIKVREGVNKNPKTYDINNGTGSPI